MLKEHTSFFSIDDMWDLNLPVLRTWSAPAPSRGRPSQPSSGAERGRLWGRHPANDCLELPGGMYCLTFQQKCQLSSGKSPSPARREHHRGLGVGHLALQLELAWPFQVHRGEGSRGKTEQ